MTPTIFPGDIVLVDRKDPGGDKEAFKDGRIYAIRDAQGGCSIKRLYGSDGGYIVSSDNKSIPPQIAWTGDLTRLIIGRVVWGWRDLLEV
jgi:phage repressor protein C with HTH and peptisase S24 domain